MRCYIYFLLMLFCSSCELAVNVDVPKEKSKLVLNSFFTIDSLWHVELTRSNFILESDYYFPVEDATVIIYQDEIAIDTLLSVGPGVYQSSSQGPTNNNSYQIKVKSNTYGNVSATSSAPAVTPILSAEIKTVQDEKFITFTFEDRANEDNFYKITAESERHSTYNGVTTVHRSPLYLTSVDPIFSDNNDDEFNRELFFNDKHFPGKIISLAVKGQSNIITSETLYLHLKTLSREIYQFETTFNLQRNTADDPFATPVNVYNNIEGGYGIFGGLTESTYIYKE